MTDTASAPPGRRSYLKLATWIVLLLVLTGILLALGTWQVNRLHWKQDLIARVEARVQGEPQAAPGRVEWAAIDAADYEYRRVRTSGTFLHDDETLVYASTVLGPGYWVVTPLKMDDGSIVLVNRGFVPTDRRKVSTRAGGNPAGPVTVTGLLRISEPGGTLLRANVPGEDRWYSRDVAAIASAHELQDVAPYFIDADANANPGGLPVGGLTQVKFPNSHLVYAITWYALAAMTSGLIVYLLVFERRRRLSSRR
ncbi:SURF1 family protein [Rhizobiaceae bacterium n13]|uniref:SURF1 family protein n=1 Tax=Ferirhizobium litorale TaxID=2927786 RepID=UPI0024B2C362|nr:SURF1 family protein [Fererhizobium litorale]MDI7862151.1 SURF1 family protein [Fererhizobium litorale]